MSIVVNIGHCLLIGPLLAYIGLVQPQEKIYYIVILLLAIALITVFIWRLILRKLYPWLFVHFIFFAFLLGYVGMTGTFIGAQYIQPFSYSLLLAIGVAAFGYHLIRLVQHSVA